MSSKKGKRESLQAIDVLKDLWLSTLLPRDRKLRAFASRPFHQLVGASSSQLKKDRQLLLWHVEEQVKSCYQSYVATLQSLLRDPVVDVRSKLLGAFAGLVMFGLYLLHGRAVVKHNLHPHIDIPSSSSSLLPPWYNSRFVPLSVISLLSPPLPSLPSSSRACVRPPYAVS